MRCTLSLVLLVLLVASCSVPESGPEASDSRASRVFTDDAYRQNAQAYMLSVKELLRNAPEKGPCYLAFGRDPHGHLLDPPEGFIRELGRPVLPVSAAPVPVQASAEGWQLLVGSVRGTVCSVSITWTSGGSEGEVEAQWATGGGGRRYRWWVRRDRGVWTLDQTYAPTTFWHLNRG
jgi:hypothetical protein